MYEEIFVQNKIRFQSGIFRSYMPAWADVFRSGHISAESTIELQQTTVTEPNLLYCSNLNSAFSAAQCLSVWAVHWAEKSCRATGDYRATRLGTLARKKLFSHVYCLGGSILRGLWPAAVVGSMLCLYRSAPNACLEQQKQKVRPASGVSGFQQSGFSD